jgi:hypothetical protein
VPISPQSCCDERANDDHGHHETIAPGVKRRADDEVLARQYQ